MSLKESGRILSKLQVAIFPWGLGEERGLNKALGF